MYRFILFNVLKWELQYCKQFWDDSATIAIGLQKMPIF